MNRRQGGQNLRHDAKIIIFNPPKKSRAGKTSVNIRDGLQILALALGIWVILRKK